MKVDLEFQIKRGVINASDLEEDEAGVLQKCLKLAQAGNHGAAAELLLPKMSFEWDWSNGDGDAEEFFVEPIPINFDCTADNCSLRVGENDGQLIITASVQFSAEGQDGIDSDQLTAWLGDNSMYSCGYVSGGWGYDGSDGDNVWLVALDGKLMN